MISGDDAAIAEVRSAVGNIEAAETKRSLGFHSANTLTPQAAADEIRRRVEAGVRGRQRLAPHRIPGPVTVDVSFKNYLPSEVLAYLPLFERTDSHSVRFRATDMAQASAIMAFITGYAPDITP
jgi:D-amino peptidase